jgi:hypothetical protein
MKRLVHYTAATYSSLERVDVYATVEYPRGVIYYNRNKMSNAQDFADWIETIPLPGRTQILRFEETGQRYNEIDDNTFGDFDVQFVCEFTDTIPIFKFVRGVVIPNVFDKTYISGYPLNEFDQFTMLTQITSTQYALTSDPSKTQWSILGTPFTFNDDNGPVIPAQIIYDGGGVTFNSPPTPPVYIMSGSYFTLVTPIGGELLQANVIPVVQNTTNDRYVEITRTLKDWPSWESRVAEFLDSIETSSLPPPYNSRIVLIENSQELLPITQGAQDNWSVDDLILESDWLIASPSGPVDNTIAEEERKTCWQRVKTCQPPNLVTNSHRQPNGVVGMGETYDGTWGYTKHKDPWVVGPQRGLLWLEYDNVQYVMTDFDLTKENIESWLDTIPLPGDYHVFPVLDEFAFRNKSLFTPLPATTIEILFECDSKVPILRGYNFHYYDNYPFDNVANFDTLDRNRWKISALGFIETARDSDNRLVFQGPLLHNPFTSFNTLVEPLTAFTTGYDEDYSFKFGLSPYIAEGFGNNWVEELTVANNEWSVYDRYSHLDDKYRNTRNWRNHLILGRVLPNDFWSVLSPSRIPDFESDEDLSWDLTYVQPGCWYKRDGIGWVFVCSDWGVDGSTRTYSQEFRYQVGETLPNLEDECSEPPIIIEPIEPGPNRLWGYVVANGVGAQSVTIINCNSSTFSTITPDPFTGFWEIYVSDGAYGVIYQNSGCTTRFESTYFLPIDGDSINARVEFDCPSERPDLDDPIEMTCEET